MKRTKLVMIGNLTVAIFLILLPSLFAADAPRLIEITATKDAKFKVAGQKDPVITAKPNEVLRLKITSQKGPEFEKDGAVHTFTIKELKDQGWDLRLFEGTKEYTLVAPEKPGEYLIECTIKCGPNHEKMQAKLVVKP